MRNRLPNKGSRGSVTSTHSMLAFDGLCKWVSRNGAVQLGDVPRPDFIGAGRKQLGLFVIGVSQLVSPFESALVVGENAIHRPHATQILTFVKQLRVDLPWCLISETPAVKLIKHHLSFFDRKCPSGGRSWLGLPIGLATTINRRPRNI